MFNKVSEGFPKSRSFLSDHVAANTPEVLTRPSLLTCRASVGFVHQIGTRPPLFMLFTKLPVRSLSLQPGHLLCILSDALSSRLVRNRFQSPDRLLATWC